MALRLLARRAAPLLPRQTARAMSADGYNIPTIQKSMQEHPDIAMQDNPTYLKRKGSDKAVAILGLVVSCVGGLYAMGGHFNMAHGQNKID